MGKAVLEKQELEKRRSGGEVKEKEEGVDEKGKRKREGATQKGGMHNESKPRRKQ